MRRRSFSIAILCLLAVTLATPLLAQERYPSRPITAIVPMNPGGGTDLVGRAFAEALKKQLNQNIVVENVPGAGSAIGTTKLHGSKPDGHTLGVIGGFLVSTSLLGAAKFPATDLTHIARLSQETFVLSVKADAPWKTLQDIIDASKKEPGKITLGTAGSGALTHLAAEALNQKTGAKFNAERAGNPRRPAGRLAGAGRAQGNSRCGEEDPGRSGHQGQSGPRLAGLPQQERPDGHLPHGAGARRLHPAGDRDDRRPPEGDRPPEVSGVRTAERRDRARG